MYLQRASDKISRAQIVWIYNGWTPGPQKNRQQGGQSAAPAKGVALLTFITFHLSSSTSGRMPSTL